MPYSFKDDIILAVRVDCEFRDDGRTGTTEYGLSYIDTRDIKNVPPGPSKDKGFSILILCDRLEWCGK